MKPILFNIEMVRAILDGRKTETRRPIKPQPKELLKCVIQHETKGMACWMEEGADQLDENFRFYKSYEVGDILYVRETWQCFNPYSDKEYVYKATNDCSDVINMKWLPSIHMPREAARIFLRVTGVTVEKLHSVTNDNALKEGFVAIGDIESRLRFKINWPYKGEFGWDKNPWVWVIKFERVNGANL